jgi:hypothetical protein
MGLFQSLFRLFPSGSAALEDFHSEITAHVVQSAPELTLDWLKEVGATTFVSADVLVQTQEELIALEAHATGSRPDIRINSLSPTGVN